MLIGPVASGKSTLLQALLGEIVQMRGEVWYHSSDIAFCGQQPWLMNTSIRNSILGACEMDETWYETVLDACDLAEDIQGMPNGDNTLTGSSGIALSGGQKQRIVSETKEIGAER